MPDSYVHIDPIPPVFIYAEDDPSDLEMHNDLLTAALWYEEIDIEDGLYSGWDVKGRPLKIIMDPRPKVVLVDDKPQIEELHSAILRYGNSCDPEVPFALPENIDNAVVLYEAARKYHMLILEERWNRTLLGKIARIFRRY